jgi:hypothetical protein
MNQPPDRCTAPYGGERDHLQPISHVHFKRTAEHTNRDREPFGGFRGREVDRSMPIEGVNPFHVGSRIKGRPLHRTLRRGKRSPPTDLQRPFQTDRGTYHSRREIITQHAMVGFSVVGLSDQ